MDDNDVIDVLETDERLDAAAAAEAEARKSSTSRSALARAGLIVTGLFLVSRILGYVRTVVIAAAVPDVGQLGPFFAAFRIPDFLFQLVAAGALSSALIPVVAALFATDLEARAWRVISTVTTLMLGALVALAGVVLLLAPDLVAAIAPGFDAAELATTVELTRIMVLSPMLLAAGAVATSALNAKGRFSASGMAPLAYNLAIIVGALALVPPFGVKGLAYGVVLGAAGHVLVQVPSLWRIGARIVPRLDLRDDQARLALVLMIPRAIGLGFTQVVFLVMTSLATTLGDEALAVFNFAFSLLQIPIGVIGVPLGVVLLPSLSREAATGVTDGFRRLLVRGLSILGYVMLVITALGIVLAEDVVRLLFGFAHIGEHAIESTGLQLTVFMVGLTAHSLIAVLARAFYALKDTRTPVVAAILAVVVNVLVANALVGGFGLAALAMAIAAAAWIETLALVLMLQRRVPDLGLAHVGSVLVRSLVASAAGGAVAWLVYGALVGAWGQDPGFAILLLRSVIVAAVGGGVIVVGSLALRIGELRTIVGVVADIARRRGRA